VCPADVFFSFYHVKLIKHFNLVLLTADMNTSNVILVAVVQGSV